MNVKELINHLNNETNKEKEVYMFLEDEIYSIEDIDYTISDRLDINVKR